MAAVPESPIGPRLLALGWRAGSVLPADFLGTLLPHLRHGIQEPPQHIDDEIWGIVTSQTCDLVVPKDDAEPYVEILLGRELHAKKPRTQYCDLRSTRILDFRPDRSKYADLILTADASSGRFFVPRQLLLDASPDPNRYLSANAIRKLQGWFALRCSRPAWPNNFVKRIQGNRNELEKALEPLKDDIAEMRIAISPPDRELNDDESYKVTVFFVIDAELYRESIGVRCEVTAAFAKFVAALDRCDGINLDHDKSDVVSGDEFSWQMIGSTEIWDFSYLSPYE